MDDYVVCINFLVVELLSNVYTSTPRLRAFPIFIPDLYEQDRMHYIRPSGRPEYFPFTLIILTRTGSWRGTLSYIVGRRGSYMLLYGTNSCAVFLFD